MKILAPKNENDDIVNKKYVDDGLSGKQATLVSGNNIKTINNQNVLGSGNIDISNYIFDTEVGVWYSFTGLNTLDGVVISMDGYELGIIPFVVELLTMAFSELENSIENYAGYLANYVIPSSCYIDSSKSHYLSIDILNVGSVMLEIEEGTDNYVFTSAIIHSKYSDLYGVSFDASSSTPNLNVIYAYTNIEKKKVASETIKNIVACTTAEYNESSKSSDTIYLITD